MRFKRSLSWSIAIAFSLLLVSCSSQVVKGNIYRKGFKDGKLESQITRLTKGGYAIIPFKGIVENRMMGIATDGNAIADLLTIQMLYRGYNVLEREKMNKILEEKAFKESDLVSPAAVDTTNHTQQATPTAQFAQRAEALKSMPENTDRYVKIGKLLGVDFIVTGSVIQYEWEVSKAGIFGGGGDISLAATITTRIIDVQTGDILFAMSAGTTGNNLPEALDGITMAFTSALKEGKVYVWE
jgi:hypothetical protein